MNYSGPFKRELLSKSDKVFEAGRAKSFIELFDVPMATKTTTQRCLAVDLGVGG
ncbi:hypothetical protein CEXT_447431, partial [Caerostris extrusa]